MARLDYRHRGRSSSRFNLLVLQLLVQLLQSLPQHAVLVSQVQKFLDSPHYETLAAMAKDNFPSVSPLSLQLLSTTLSLVYQMVREERDSGSLLGTGDAASRKAQKTTAARGSLRQLSASQYEITVSASDREAAPVTFTSFIQKHQAFLLLLLARYSQPSSNPHLRAYLGAVVRGAQISTEQVDPSMDWVLERGDETMQEVLKKVLALLVVQVSPTSGMSSASAASRQHETVFFGPFIGDGGGDGGAWGEEQQDAHNPAQPQLELLLSILHDNHSRLQTSHRQLFQLGKSLEQLSQASTMPSASSSSVYPSLTDGSETLASGGGSASNLASLELEIFPPSIATAYFYELESSQRVKLLRQKLEERQRTNEEQIEKYVWNLEHALLVSRRVKHF